jgi:hypothetical protein
VTKMIVMKPFMAESGMLKSGDIVDVSNFRNTRNLVNARYLRSLGDDVPESPAPGSKDAVLPPKPTAKADANPTAPSEFVGEAQTTAAKARRGRPKKSSAAE